MSEQQGSEGLGADERPQMSAIAYLPRSGYHIARMLECPLCSYTIGVPRDALYPTCTIVRASALICTTSIANAGVHIFEPKSRGRLRNCLGPNLATLDSTSSQ